MLFGSDVRLYILSYVQVTEWPPAHSAYDVFSYKI